MDRQQNKKICIGIAGLFAACTLPAGVQAQSIAPDQVNLDLQIGAHHSDNAARTANTVAAPEDDEIILTGGLSLSLIKNTARLSANVNGSVDRRFYQDGVFEDETQASVAASASAMLIEDRLTWSASANHGQLTIDPLRPITPLNREDITYLSTGPALSLPLGDRTSLQVGAQYSAVNYELSLRDNNRVSGNIGLQRDLSSTLSLTLSAGTSEIEYDRDDVNPDVTTTDATLGVSHQTDRNSLSLRAGWNEVERLGVKDNGPLVELNWTRLISPTSTLSVTAGTRYATTGDLFTLLQTGPVDQGNVDGVDTSSSNEPFQNDYALASLTTSRVRTSATLGIQWRKQEFDQQSGRDRTTTGISASAGYNVTPDLTASVFANFNRRDFSGSGIEDDDVRYGFGLDYVIGPRSRLMFDISQLRRNSDVSTGEFEEVRGSLVFTYSILGSR